MFLGGPIWMQIIMWLAVATQIFYIVVTIVIVICLIKITSRMGWISDGIDRLAKRDDQNADWEKE